MPYKCCIVGCKSNYDTVDEKTSTFGFPDEVKEHDRRERWIKFVNRKNFVPNENTKICERHFELVYVKKGIGENGRTRLIKTKKPVPTILDPDVKASPVVSHMKAPSAIPRKSPRKRIFQEDEYEKFVKQDTISSFDDMTESLAPLGYQTNRYNDHIVYYRMQVTELGALEINECIRVDRDLHVKLFYKGSPLPLPTWFRHGTNCRLATKSALNNFPNYIKNEGERSSSVFEELSQLRFKNRPFYSSNVIRYALLLRYTSLQSYKMLCEHFQLPSLSLLRKITKGTIDAVKCATKLKTVGKISEDVVLMLDEMFLQKVEEYCGGKSIGANENNELYKGLVAFMIVGMKENVPYVIKASPDTAITGEWLQEQIKDCLKTLKSCGFNVRAIVCDNHASNISAYDLLLQDCGQDPDSTYMMFESKKIYLLYDTVHLIKTIRNNLLNYKRFIFPSFRFDGFEDVIEVASGEMSWKTLHDVHDKDMKLDSYFRKAPKLSYKALHPGNRKQSVPLALSVFDSTTSAAIESYFPDRKASADFLRLIDTWWVISNAKQQFSSRRIGHAVTKGDKKPEFLRKFADWIEEWHAAKIPGCQKFTLSTQTSSALTRTLRGQASLLEDLLSEGYKFVLTARLQSDPLERRFGQYRQMSGGRFLVSLKDTTCSEKILKIKSLLKAGVDLDESVRTDTNQASLEKELLQKIDELRIRVDTLQLSSDSREVAVCVAGYIAKKLKEKKGFACCKNFFVGRLSNENDDHAYIRILSRGGLTVPSPALAEYVCNAFSILDIAETTINQSELPERDGAERTLAHLFGNVPEFTCSKHLNQGKRYCNRVIANIFFNNRRRIATAEVRKDDVESFKRLKREL